MRDIERYRNVEGEAEKGKKYMEKRIGRKRKRERERKSWEEEVREIDQQSTWEIN